jgi:hypothetical protein
VYSTLFGELKLRQPAILCVPMWREEAEERKPTDGVIEWSVATVNSDSIQSLTSPIQFIRIEDSDLTIARKDHRENLSLSIWD